MIEYTIFKIVFLFFYFLTTRVFKTLVSLCHRITDFELCESYTHGL